MEKIVLILVAFQVKHFLADYPLQTPYMLGKFKEKGWILPLSAHAGVHAFMTLILVFFLGWNKLGGIYYWSYFIFLLPVLDFAIHFTMDRIKASPNMLGRFKPDNKYFWWALGFDQMIHHLTHYLIMFILVYNAIN